MEQKIKVVVNGGRFIECVEGEEAIRLSRAAPDLLEALQNMMGIFDNAVYRRKLRDDALYPEAISIARAAIKKATQP